MIQIENFLNMKKTVLGMAAAALLFAGCSKEELVEETIPSEGVSSVASSPGQEKNFWSDAPSIWFNQNNGRMFVRLKENPGYSFLISKRTAAINNEDGGHNNDLEVVELQRVGNSRIFRSARGAVEFSNDTDFSLVDIELENGEEEVWSGSIFLYPSGRTVAQNPTLARLRIGPSLQTGTSANGKNWRMIIADDPTQTVASVSVKAATVVDEDGQEVDEEDLPSFELEETHFNQNLGLRRYIGRQINAEVSRNYQMTFMGSDSYDVDFLNEEANAVIISKYTVADVSNETIGVVTTTEVDEPEFLGTALRSKTGETWTYEVALADLGDWVETVTLTFPEQEGVFPTQSEFDMQLVRSEGNLKVFRTEGILFEGLEFGTDVQALVAGFGRGNRSTATAPSNKAELL